MHPLSSRRHPRLQKFYAEHANDTDFEMVGIVRGDEKSTVENYVRDEGVHWTIALDPDQSGRARLRDPRAARDLRDLTGWGGDRGEVRTDVDGGAGGLPRLGAGGRRDPAVGPVGRARGRGGYRAGRRALAQRQPVDGRGAAHSLETEFKCPECQGLSVADSQAPTSRAIRADIKRRIAAGQSDEEIRQAFVDRYGETILLTPQSSGVSLLVWILPVVVLALGASGIVFALRRNRDEPHLHATAADERLVERSRGDE